METSKRLPSTSKKNAKESEQANVLMDSETFSTWAEWAALVNTFVDLSGMGEGSANPVGTVTVEERDGVFTMKMEMSGPF
jgi:hypothetical protein